MAQKPKDISVLASEIGLDKSDVEIHGPTKAKVRLEVLDKLKHQKNGKYIIVVGYGFFVNILCL